MVYATWWPSEDLFEVFWWGWRTKLVHKLKLNVSSVGDLLKIKEELTKQRDKLLSEVVALRENLTKATDAQQEIEAEKNKAMDTIAQV